MTARRDAPFFLLGAARSGTTLLRLMLHRHPRIAVPPESHFLIDLLDRLPRTGPLRPEERAAAADIVSRHRRFSAWPVSATDLAAAFGDADGADLARLVDVAFRLAAGDKPRWGDKTPRYTDRWRDLAALFPEALFLHLLRDGRAVSRSLEQVGWHGPGEVERAAYWRRLVGENLACHDALGPERSHLIRYEELVTDPPTVLRRASEFLGQRYHPSMLDFHLDATAQLSDLDGPVHGNLSRPPHPADAVRWRRTVDRAHLETFEREAATVLTLAGYPLTRPPGRHAT